MHIYTYLDTYQLQGRNSFKTDKMIRYRNKVCVTVRLRVINHNVQISLSVEETKVSRSYDVHCRTQVYSFLRITYIRAFRVLFVLNCALVISLYVFVRHLLSDVHSAERNLHTHRNFGGKM